MVEDLPFATRRRRALERLDDVQHIVLARGPEGDQVHYDEKGRRQTSKARTEYHGYEKYLHQLRAEAGLIDPQLERLVTDLKRAESFWGEGPEKALDADEAETDG